MVETIVVLAEEPIEAADIRNLQTLAGEDAPSYFVVIPEDRHKNVLGEFLHHLSLLEFAEAFRDLSQGQPSPEETRVSAESSLQRSLAALAAAGLDAQGAVAPGNAVEAVVNAANERQARQAVVITRPHAVADTFHTDWANQAQDKLGVPVLHLYSGSGFIGDS
ncbi:hypothetical protein GCM10027403_32520 [Arthrobacter tecti]